MSDSGSAPDEASKTRVLLAEDDAVSRKLVEVRLRGFGYDVVAVRDGEQAWEVLAKDDAPQLAVIDWEMPKMDGIEVCRRLRSRDKERAAAAPGEEIDPRYTFVVLLTGRNKLSDLVDGFDAGADDYLTKPFEAPELHARLRAGERIVALEQNLLAMKKRLEIEATHDALTGVWNRRAIMALIDRELSRGQRLDTPLSVTLLDIDHFKKVNDTYGHQAGDDVLVETASRFAGIVRGYDAVGRYGGEEFVVAFSGCAPPHGAPAAERLRQRLCEEPVQTRVGAIPITASFGVAHAGADRPYVPVDTLIKAADRALYRAKASGRNRVEIAVDDDYADASDAEDPTPTPRKA